MSVIENKQPIPARLYNAAKGGHVAGAIDIIDDTLEKTQDQINQETVGTDNASLKNRINAIQMLIDLSGTGEPVPLTTNPEDIVAVGEGAIKVPLCIAVAGKFAELIGTSEDPSDRNTINGLRAAINAIYNTVVGTEEDTADTNSIRGLRAALTQLGELLQQEVNSRGNADIALLGTDEDTATANTIKGLRAAVTMLSQEIQNIPQGGGGGGGGSTIVTDQTKHIVLTEQEYEDLEEYEPDALYLIIEDSDWGLDDGLPIILT